MGTGLAMEEAVVREGRGPQRRWFSCSGSGSASQVDGIGSDPWEGELIDTSKQKRKETAEGLPPGNT